MNNIYGQFNRNLDDRNRVILPVKIRDLLGTKFYITIGMNGVIELRSEKEFQKLTESLTYESNFDPLVRKLKRFWLGNSQEIELDSQNRFIIPKTYLDKAAIQKEVLLLGVGDIVEIWNPQVYQQYLDSISEEELLEAANAFASRQNAFK
ncbi:division/cell wall cluster transcriptional repressor MraZ [Mycoplasma sp. 744]|uniref:division/cell wall cluster transcriptional repressor MraZ n=1 Tax=unclassified Mycoplasma TaxID=2683645 RepID=UPI00211C9F4A|nr:MULTISPECIES: division/cell wall cluster transcriptional repressor MraZ [unclassified Mycoplasma]MEA4115495.1 division/cell wall cluster transcriptional repressor MraZ [Mycoplasma sp. 744]UUM18994.1 division/cell wall cluster transcriptional repressor MraZ [Mycoplasma sp. 1018B]